MQDFFFLICWPVFQIQGLKNCGKDDSPCQTIMIELIWVTYVSEGLLQIKSSLRRRWAHILLLHHLVRIVIPHVQGQRRSPNKTVGGTKSHLESNPRPARNARRLKQNLVRTRTQRPHRDWARLAFECSILSCGGMGHQWLAAGTGALAAADLGYPACGISPLWKGHH